MMSGIKTAGELRGFLAEVLLSIRSGEVAVEEANAIAKVAGQINQSLAVEAKTAIELQRMGGTGHVAGSMLIASGDVVALAGPKWCEQCEAQVTVADASSCKQKFCKARAA
jgi:hypothetical protein